jgi:extracellular factor (EF) 3-hydroxypalmitic acid methyl ester biosynthesis protein
MTRSLSSTQGKQAIALEHLTGDDERLLIEKAIATSYAAGEQILEQNSRIHALFIVEKGAVRVEKEYLGQRIVVARLASGDLFGEMSFLEDTEASASIVADTDAVIRSLESSAARSLLHSVPGLATRFYESLALLLSKRLRDITSELPAFIVEDVPQVNRFHAPRAGKGESLIPSSLRSDVEEFKDVMLAADRQIAKTDTSDHEVQASVSQACSLLKSSLTRHVQRERQLESAIGAFLFRETFSLLMLSRIIDRTFTKPRGYAGDYLTIELMYQDTPTGDGRLGRFVDRWTLDQAATIAVKNRRELIATAVRESLRNWTNPEPMPATSLASGPAREAFDVLAGGDDKVHFTCVDIDHEALAYVANQAQEKSVRHKFTLAKENVVRLSRGKAQLTLPQQQLIYSIGLIDYLADECVVDLLNWGFDNLLPGGTIIVGNFDPKNPDKEFMDHVLEWVLIHRTPDQMREIFSRSKFGNTPIKVVHEAAGVNLFAFGQKQ